MTRRFGVQSIEAPRGGRAFGMARAAVAAQMVETPVFVIHGLAEGPTLTVIAGVHGAEYASIQAALHLGRTLQPDRLRGRVIVAPVANMPGYRARSMYVCPLDGQNLNRVFPGRADGTASEQLAHWLFENLIRPADCFVDLHGGDLGEALTPFALISRSGDAALDGKTRELGQVAGLPHLLIAEVAGSSIGAAMAAGVPSLVLEAGGQGLWPPEVVKVHTDGIDRLMRRLGMVEGPPPAARAVEVLDRMAWLRAEQEGCLYTWVTVGETVRRGQRVGEITDWEGNVLQALSAPEDGKVMFLMTLMAIGKGDPVLAVGGVDGDRPAASAD